ncbi:MAG: hypothetical protein MAG581_01942 [Deltaproteobacteria bacterium]|nr:hypothetical protein [Deltaproteobacteria bacterium]
MVARFPMFLAVMYYGAIIKELNYFYVETKNI